MPKRFIACFLLFTMLFSCVLVYSKEELSITSPSAVLMEMETGKILYEKNSHEILPPASVTKIMTILLIMEAIDSGKISYDDMVVGSARAKSMGGSTIFLEEGEMLSVRDMLKGIVVASGNDAAVAMAEYIGGSEEAFIDLMNKKAYELGMKDTNFVNCNGLDDENTYNTTSAYDIALMSRELMLKHSSIKEFTTIWMDSLRNGKFQLSNTNKLIRFYEGATGLKTGSTSKAKNCLSATATRNGLSLVAVIMKAPSSKERFFDASSLLNYGFGAYKIESIIKKDEFISNVDVKKGIDETVEIVSKEDYSYLMSKTDDVKITKKLILEDYYIAPIKAGDLAGKIEIYNNDKMLYEIDAIFKKDVDKKKILSVYGLVLSIWAGRKG